jgi:protein-S-isoprenylcysteine O-methyltransferase Ste14
MNDNTSTKQQMTPKVKRGVISWIAKAVGGLVFFALLLFLCAGRWDWVWGWVFLALFLVASIVDVLILIPTNPALLADRSRGIREGTKGWDKWITSFAAGLLPMASWVISALDVRNEWSPPFEWSQMSLGLHVGGGVFFALGWALLLWATASNAFFSTTVRIQEERGHAVASSGPYRYVRHPGYVGYITAALATALALGSLWALVPAGLGMCLFVVRTALEDRTLQEELAGYREYAQRVRYRLLPGIW